MSITPELLRTIRNEANAALADIAARHGLSKFAVGKASYTSDNFSFKLEGVQEGGLDPAAARYDRFAASMRLPALGTTFVSKYRDFKITGMNTTGSKVIAKDVASGKSYLFETNYVAVMARSL